MRQITTSTLVFLALVFFSCSHFRGEGLKSIAPKNSRVAELKLADSLGTIEFFIPRRYDTSFEWIDQSDCGKPCDIQKYRYQPKEQKVQKESGWAWVDSSKDSIEWFTVSHSADIHFRGDDTTKNAIGYKKFKDQLISENSNTPIVFDTLQKIYDRYYSIFGMERAGSKKVIAVTAVKGNLIRFQYDLLSKQDDSISKNFIRNSIDLVRTIHINTRINGN